MRLENVGQDMFSEKKRRKYETQAPHIKSRVVRILQEFHSEDRTWTEKKLVRIYVKLGEDSRIQSVGLIAILYIGDLGWLTECLRCHHLCVYLRGTRLTYVQKS